VGIQTEGELFEAVQLGRVFPDSKTFVDAVPRRPAAAIASAFGELQASGVQFDLRRFVDENFDLPIVAHTERIAAATADEYVERAWPSLTRQHLTVPTGSTLLPLPYAYVVPGGRFEELFYWDSYFTGLGLIKHGYIDLFTGMVDNFVDLQSRLGWIPNGTRTYLTSRSQPPLLALMVRALAAAGRASAGYLTALLAEHAFWMQPESSPSAASVSAATGIRSTRPDQSRSPKTFTPHNVILWCVGTCAPPPSLDGTFRRVGVLGATRRTWPPSRQPTWCRSISTACSLSSNGPSPS
jgi:alpha,alpha-trehalase